MTGSGGLSSAQVQASRQQHGCNRLTACNENKLVSRFLSGFSDPIIRILLIALCINLLFMLRGAPWFETVGIAAAVFLATFISALSEYGSDAAFRRMQTEAANVTCRVRRNGGRIVVIPADDVVCGDLILLQAGESIPADGVLREGQVDVNQSALTGENHDLHKTLDAELLRGSVVTSGEGIMEATAVGSKTVYGGMAQQLDKDGIVKIIGGGSFAIPENFEDKFFFVEAVLKDGRGETLSRSVYWPRCLAAASSDKFKKDITTMPIPYKKQFPWPTLKNGPWLKPAANAAGKAELRFKTLSIDQKGETAEAEIEIRNDSANPSFMTTVDIGNKGAKYYATDNFFWLPPHGVKRIKVFVSGIKSEEKPQFLISSWNAK